jgi:hypothetical protein
MTTTLSLGDALERYQTQEGVTLLDLSRRSPVLLVFLRHFG